MISKTDLMMQGRTNIASYRAMLESLLDTGLPAIMHREAWTHQGVDERYLCIRHDVDHNLEMALEMGLIEYELGIRATYFLLPPGDYNKSENYYGVIVDRRIQRHARLREVALALTALGHEIGLHNDFVQLSMKLRRPVEELIVEEIAYFRSFGIEVVGSAAHGSRLAREYGFVNYEIFAECPRANQPARTVALPEGASFQTLAIPMASLGLLYEAYSLKRDVYISDSGARLQIGKEQYESLPPTMMVDMVAGARKVVALIHPEWWKRVEPVSAPKENTDTIARAYAEPLNLALSKVYLSRKWVKLAASVRKIVALARPQRRNLLEPAPVSVAVPANISLPALAVASGGVSEADKPCFERADGKPFRIAIRGDCCSRRAMAMNRALFPKGVELIINEKCPNSAFLDTMQGRAVPAGSGDIVSNVAAMTGSQRQYYVNQFERSVLEARDVDLLVFDTYSDMNFELWRHQAEGWALWVHPKFVRQPEVLQRDFKKVGRATVEQAAEAMCAVIDRVRELNPSVPVMVLHQPVEYYPKLKDRTDFYQLGEMLAARRHGVYAAAALAHSELVPADVGSCGPGLTLHFDGPTYLKMIADAWNKGLADHFRQGAAPKHIAKAAAISDTALSAVTSESTIPAAQAQPVSVAARPPASAVDGLPVVAVGYGQGHAGCGRNCPAQVDAAFKTYAMYFRHLEVDASAPQPRFTPMLIPTATIADFDAWEAHIKTFGNGARLRQKRKAINANYYVKLFPWKLHIPDVHSINHSKKVRSGGLMRGNYLHTVEEMGGAPARLYKVVMPSCGQHWSLTFGVFLKEPGHFQGSIQVDERLVAYISLRRCGDVALYSQILGHGDHLKQGVLVLLHHEVIRWVSEHRDSHAKGLHYVMYGGMQNGGESLLQFKRQAGFTAHDVTAHRAELPEPAASNPSATPV